MLPIDIVQYTATVGAIIGAILNAKKYWQGFLFWVVANSCWLAFTLAMETYGLFITYIVFQGTAIAGVYYWKYKGE